MFGIQTFFAGCGDAGVSIKPPRKDDIFGDTFLVRDGDFAGCFGFTKYEFELRDHLAGTVSTKTYTPWLGTVSIEKHYDDKNGDKFIFRYAGAPSDVEVTISESSSH